MSDPLTDVVTLLKPLPSVSKLVSGRGRWQVARGEVGRPFYCAVIEGQIRLTIHGQPSRIVEPGDFVLVPAMYDFTSTSLEPPAPGAPPARMETSPGHFRLGLPGGTPEVQMLVGHCDFATPDSGVLVSLLPEVIHVRGEARLTALVRMIHEETRAERVARELVLTRLLEVLLIEALRCGAGAEAPPGLLRGLLDPRLGAALRALHGDPAQGWTVAELARRAGMSRSAFFEHFGRALGVAPMDYLLGWRMALAKDLLGRGGLSLAEVARRVGYGSASAFSVAFSRQVGLAPGAYARQAAVGLP